jgi:hypothetical protein
MGNESTNLCFLNGLDSMAHHRGAEGTEKNGLSEQRKVKAMGESER